MKIRELPAIRYDESLSSWIARVSQFSGDQSVSDLAAQAEDPDFDLKSPAVVEALSRLSVGLRQAERVFGAETSWTLPWRQRAAYCTSCLMEDVAAGGAPYWRRRWCYLHYMVCEFHKCLLVAADSFSLDLHKSWTVFIDECNGKYYRKTKCHVPWRQPETSSQIVALALRVQEFLLRAHKSELVRLPGCGLIVKSAYILALVRFLLENFLLPRLLPPYGEGAARGGQSGLERIRGVTSLEEAKLLGCSDCHVYSRMTALILVGCVLKLFPVQRYKKSRDRLPLPFVVYSGNGYDIGYSGIHFGSANDYRTAMRLIDGLPGSLREHLEDFINGMSNFGRRRGYG